MAVVAARHVALEARCLIGSFRLDGLVLQHEST